MDDLTLLVDFLNTRDERRFAIHDHTHVPHDDLVDARGLRRFLSRHGLLNRPAPFSDRELRLARELRDSLRAAVSRAAGGRRPLEQFPLAASLAEDGRPQLLPLKDGVVGALSRIAAAAVVAEANGSWPRLKLCAADNCRFAFFDTSKNRLGRWCSMAVCGNRVKTRMYRQRLRAPAA